MKRPRIYRMRIYLFWAVVTLLAAMIQTNWPGLLKFQEVTPDIILVCLVYFAIAFGEEWAMFTGLLGGLYLDVAVGTTLGHHVLCYVVTGYILGRLSTRLISEHAAIKAGAVFLAGGGWGILYTSIQYFQRPQSGMLQPLISNIIPTAFYSAILTPVVFLTLDRIFHRRDYLGGGLQP